MIALIVHSNQMAHKSTSFNWQLLSSLYYYLALHRSSALFALILRLLIVARCFIVHRVVESFHDLFVSLQILGICLDSNILASFINI